eukprot:CAMPEP_0117755672 /NCGR_PEP_ID=MMETSP0947-20121206/13587_1 /TAXON_ID=44440 /ORGANISM="Chattonella subsalsa, Strain CCMP2191" /LENGTH=140 /DNA_ID=CAMNT_0005575043 /DNA_START=635 /DNA_END=1057 /DNA_ORIENTATION=+
MDEIVEQAGLRLPSVLQQSMFVQSERNEHIQNQNLLEGTDRCLGEIISEILKAIETVSVEEAQVRIVVLFAQFSEMFTQLLGHNQEYAVQCLDSYISFLKGPPNRPTSNRAGLLAMATRYLQEQRTAALSSMDQNTEEDS